MPAVLSIADSWAVSAAIAALMCGAIVLSARRSHRWPDAAPVLLSLMTAFCAITALRMNTAFGYGLAAVAIAYGASVLAFLSHARRLSRRTDSVLADAARQQDVLNLLLGERHAAPPAAWHFETDREGRIVHASAGLAALTGRPAERLHGQSVTALFSVGATLGGWQRLLLAMEVGQSIDCVVEIPAQAGQLWYLLSARPLHAADGSRLGCRAAARNITGERQARQQVQDEKDSGRRSSARTFDVLAGTVQSLRLQLDTVLGFADLLVSSNAADLPHTQRDAYLQTLLDNGRDLAARLTQVHDMIRLDRGSLSLIEQEIDAAELVEIAVKQCRSAAEAGDVTLMAEVYDGVEIRCDSHRLREAMAGLVSRAILESRRGGDVRVVIEKTAAGGLCIAIDGSGPGEASAAASRPLAGLTHDKEDLTLPIARRIATLHGGDVSIANLQGGGTRARLTLPASRVMWQSSGRPLDTRAA